MSAFQKKLPVIEVPLGIAGYFQIFKYKADDDGNPIESTKKEVAPYQKNLILNQGLNLFMTNTGNNFTGFCRVGSGSATPAFTDTALQSQIASSSTRQATVAGTNNSISPYYGFIRATYRFVAGTATGNISEVGIGSNTSTNLFSRALILDGGGLPTTITVLSDEVLDVVYELRNYVPAADVTGSMTLAVEGGNYSYNLRAVNVDSSAGTPWNYQQGTNWQNFAFLGSALYYTSTSTTQLAQTAAYSSGGTAQENMSTNSSLATYTNGNYYRDFTFVMDLNFGNHSGSGFASARFIFINCAWALTFSSLIPKTNTKKFTAVIRFTVARI